MVSINCAQTTISQGHNPQAGGLVDADPDFLMGLGARGLLGLTPGLARRWARGWTCGLRARGPMGLWTQGPAPTPHRSPPERKLVSTNFLPENSTVEFSRAPGLPPWNFPRPW